MAPVPRDPAFDSTLALLNEGYDFIWNRCRRLQSEMFLTRIMGQQAVCIHGREAAELFYDESKFQRTNAVPRRVVTTLFGKNALHTLDGEAHRNRKAAFLALMAPESLSRLMDETSHQWRFAFLYWHRARTVTLFTETQRVLTRAACAWAGVPLQDSEVPRRAHDFAAMVDAFGGMGPRLWKGKLARSTTERWLAEIVAQYREGRIRAREDCGLHILANLRGLDGNLLDPRTAAVELANLIRPTVAISWYITFAALALHQYPYTREKLREEGGSGDTAGEYADLFMQEIRRFYPFTPFLGALVRAPFEWRGHFFKTGTLVLLDVHGINHDPHIWGDPGRFRPERFHGWEDDAFAFIPQGGGTRMGHRCPGEWITMHNLALAIHFLARCLTYDVVPGQDLGFSLRRMPTHPRSGFVIRNVCATAVLDSSSPRQPSLTAAHDSAAAEQAGEVGTALVNNNPTGLDRKLA